MRTCLAVLSGLAVLAGSIIPTDAEAGRRNRRSHHQAYTSHQAYTPNHVRRATPGRGLRARHVILPMMLMSDGAGGQSVCVQYVTGWFCTPVR